MADLFENPIGLDGFEFLEFTAPKKGMLEPIFEAMGFTLVARHKSKDVELWRQGDINLLSNYEKKCHAAYYAEEHGPSACGMAFRVKDSQHAYKEVLARGAQPMDTHTGPMELKLPAIKGIGGAMLYLIDRYEGENTIYDIDFNWIEGVDRHPEGCGFHTLDHLTHNVYRGRMNFWAGFYEKLFNFKEIRYFDIKGEYTGLLSKAMTAPDGKIRIPLNEEAVGGGGQIEEFLMKYNGEGIQHIAFACDDLVACLDKLKAKGMKFMTPPPNTYYDMLEERLPGHGENVDELQKRGILLDGTTENGEPRLLLQIFSETVFGPVFFEFIQRKQDEGFGEGNFKALFESIERDQVNRGVLNK
ncbi:4-hydroxyphenylpyruvate dioxygenase [Alteromonas macleodii]|jgi:4-hydroxyphenylpyruvate dioxygenase|uniref:4-hydroxyphenylpyruvate dioxygenase n=1 Tax=Alteromonas macleodii TaxID=28108 RepID=A0A126PYK9_ALTMA|nr:MULTISPECIES: 4-hydroxyphenylpyruvate dioxygenase [Alteromonas]MCG8497244.1 4-hydroxyphenylpyruvate dioxygenase [Enterobacterales bacterium]MEC7082573.1 4-hydroxyphenylpyruvate dioxygenase [Pseudomonadota bacterium]NKX20616.1 4-hydroxyphenylpyruvate dioxygenase [Alteromonadaceae bacterium A_SAG2]AFS36944.1 4-hydroxyphenylpyruvate dioxygenase [Alteromonas macleodii ATCC 27126]AMJ98071.1 4-hydroxyphenylpyruvate dioxygenase [Alteromonas macleodii]|tara:strand:- start:1740 stop:2813 length:1074 start_codon:yes stop_codon:yes gene_type:complete